MHYVDLSIWLNQVWEVRMYCTRRSVAVLFFSSNVISFNCCCGWLCNNSKQARKKKNPIGTDFHEKKSVFVVPATKFKKQ